jgi:homogentisate 1,2-dioxygenase
MAEREFHYQAGFGNALATEALEGCLPARQNGPRNVAHGLIAEQLNGTGFTEVRAHNRRTWMYRLRPQIATRGYQPLSHPRFVGHFQQGRSSPEIMRFAALTLPETASDWLDGLWTFAGAGDPCARGGIALHIYRANADMERVFCNTDGDLLLCPELGRLRIQTELGWLQLGPGEIAILPRGIRFRVLLPDGHARGFVAELFDGHLRLPERGPVGANGLADERHFLAPVAAYEDRVEDTVMVVKQGGDLWHSVAAHSPFDVVAWHGSYAPFKYDLANFNAFGSVTFDHPDPSILTVLTCPGPAGNALDLVVFNERWDPTEHSFGPPFFHRNAAIEFNAVVTSPSTRGPWQAGAFSFTPYLQPHGVSGDDYRAAIAATDDRPTKVSRGSVWIQFESCYLLRVMPWAFDEPQRDADYLRSFTGYPAGRVP